MNQASYIRSQVITEAILGMLRTPTAGLRFTPSQGKQLSQAILSRASLQEPEPEPETNFVDHFVHFLLRHSSHHPADFPGKAILCQANQYKDNGKLELHFIGAGMNCLIFSLPDMFAHYRSQHPNTLSLAALRTELRSQPYWVEEPRTNFAQHRAYLPGQGQMIYSAINLSKLPQDLINAAPPTNEANTISCPFSERMAANFVRDAGIRRSTSAIRHNATKAFDLIGKVMKDGTLSPSQAMTQIAAITEQTIFPAHKTEPANQEASA
jgi:hypothetical protein